MKENKKKDFLEMLKDSIKQSQVEQYDPNTDRNNINSTNNTNTIIGRWQRAR